MNVLDRIKTVSNRLKREYKAEKVMLFGSHVKGEANEDSDIDILIIASTTESFFKRMATVKRIIRDLRNGLIFSPIVLTPEELKERLKIGDQFIEEILNNCIEI